MRHKSLKTSTQKWCFQHGRSMSVAFCVLKVSGCWTGTCTQFNAPQLQLSVDSVLVKLVLCFDKTLFQMASTSWGQYVIRYVLANVSLSKHVAAVLSTTHSRPDWELMSRERIDWRHQWWATAYKQTITEESHEQAHYLMKREEQLYGYLAEGLDWARYCNIHR